MQDATHTLPDRSRLMQVGSLALLTFLCIGMLAARIAYTGRGTYTFLGWNLFLAWVPLAFSGALQWLERRQAPLLLGLATLGAWLLFLPNAPYILTDLVHLRPRPGIPYWYDIVMVSAFAFTGLLLGFHSLAQVHHVLRGRLRPAFAWAVVALFSIGASYGIYLGRVQRWNSWDILRHPMGIVRDCVAPLHDPMAHKEAIGMSVALSGLIFLGYLFFQAHQLRRQER